MKHFVPVVVALVVGIVLGAWQPRGELLTMRAENDTLRARIAAAERGRGPMEGFRALLGAERSAVAAPDARTPDAPAAPDAEPADGTPTAASSPADAPDDDAHEQALSPRSLDEMQAALDARRAQAMAALTEQADLSDADAARVDAAMDEMNAQLKVEVDRMVAQMADGHEPDRRDMMELAANGLDIALAADDKLRAVIPAEVYATLDPEAVDPFSYVSGEALAGILALHGAAPE